MTRARHLSDVELSAHLEQYANHIQRFRTCLGCVIVQVRSCGRIYLDFLATPIHFFFCWPGGGQDFISIASETQLEVGLCMYLKRARQDIFISIASGIELDVGWSEQRAGGVLARARRVASG